MKKYLLFTLLCILLAPPVYAKRRVIVINKIVEDEIIEWFQNKRSINAFVPLVIYDGDIFYIYSETLMQEARLTIKDKNNTIIYSSIITVFPNEESTFILPISNGEYIIELECNEDSYYGYFEID